MKNKLTAMTALALILALCMALTACGDQKEANNTASAPEAVNEAPTEAPTEPPTEPPRDPDTIIVGESLQHGDLEAVFDSATYNESIERLVIKFTLVNSGPGEFSIDDYMKDLEALVNGEEYSTKWGGYTVFSQEYDSEDTEHKHLRVKMVYTVYQGWKDFTLIYHAPDGGDFRMAVYADTVAPYAAPTASGS